MWRFLGILSICSSLLAQEEVQNRPALTEPVRAVADSGLPESGSTNSVSTNAPYRIPEGRILQFNVPLTREGKMALAAKNQVVPYAKGAIVVPPNFDPELPTAILLVSGSSDADGSSIRMMPAYTNVAMRLGWIVIAAD